MFREQREHLQNLLSEIEQAGLYKSERILESRQGAVIAVASEDVLNFCANNYLGCRAIRRSSRRRTKVSMNEASGFRRCVSFAVPRISTSNWNRA